MKVFVTGATGFVGHHLLHRLKEEGHQIAALVRKGSENKLPFTDGVKIVQGGLHDSGAWKENLSGMDAVIHLVGVIREFPAQGITFEKIHFEGTRTMVRAAASMGVKKFIHMSANGAAENGASAYQTTKWRAERELIASGLEWTIFRPSVIFGGPHGRMEFTSELAKPVRMAPVMPLFGGGRYKLEPVAVEDVARCFCASLTNPQARNRIFHLGGGVAVSFQEVIQIIGTAIGKRSVSTVNVPFPLVKPVAALLGGFAFFPVTVDQLNMLAMGNVCPEHDFIKVLGVDPIRFAPENLRYLARPI